MIDDEIYEAMENQPEEFKIDSDGKASWALKILKKEQEETERLIAIADSQIREIQEKKQKIQEQYEHKTGYLKAMLFRYFQTVPHKDTKTQETYKLLDGTLYYKKPSVKIVKPDEAKLVEYMEANGYEKLVKIKKSPEWAEFKKEIELKDGQVILDDTGEVLDWIETEEDPGKFDVKL